MEEGNTSVGSVQTLPSWNSDSDSARELIEHLFPPLTLVSQRFSREQLLGGVCGSSLVEELLVNHFHGVSVSFVSIIMIDLALAEFALQRPQKFSVSSRHLYSPGIYGDLDSEVRCWRKCVYFIHCKPSIGRRATYCARSCFLIGNEKCKQHSDWSELKLSTADRVIPSRETGYRPNEKALSNLTTDSNLPSVNNKEVYLSPHCYDAGS